MSKLNRSMKLNRIATKVGIYYIILISFAVSDFFCFCMFSKLFLLWQKNIDVILRNSGFLNVPEFAKRNLLLQH